MRVLVLGINSKLAINYLNYLVVKQMEDIDFLGTIIPRVEYFCIDNNELSDDIKLNSEVNTNFKHFKLDLNKENINMIMKKYKIQQVINFHEVVKGTKDEYTLNNYDFVVDLYACCELNKIEHLTHISSATVYGSSRQTFCKENSPLKATCDYTQSKINSDLYLLSKTTVKTVILRVAELFGDVYRESFFDQLLIKIYNGSEITIEEDSDFIRPYIDVEDCIYFVSTSVRNKITGVYNICSDLHVSAKDLISKVTTIFNCSDKVVYTNTSRVKLQYSKVDSSSITKDLNYTLTRQKAKLDFYLNDLLYRYEIYKQLNLII